MFDCNDTQTHNLVSITIKFRLLFNNISILYEGLKDCISPAQYTASKFIEIPAIFL